MTKEKIWKIPQSDFDKLNIMVDLLIEKYEAARSTIADLRGQLKETEHQRDHWRRVNGDNSADAERLQKEVHHVERERDDANKALDAAHLLGMKEGKEASQSDTARLLKEIKGLNRSGLTDTGKWATLQRFVDKEAATPATAEEGWTDEDREAAKVLVDVGIVKPAASGEQGGAEVAADVEFDTVVNVPPDEEFEVEMEICEIDTEPFPVVVDDDMAGPSVEERIEAVGQTLLRLTGCAGPHREQWMFEHGESFPTVIEALTAIERIQAEKGGAK